MSESKDDQSWRSRAERGSVIGAHFMLWLATSLGRGATRLMLRPLMLYYTLTAGAAKLAVRSFLRRVDGSEPSFGRVYTQFLRLAQMMLDAILLLRGKRHHFRFTRTGKHHFAEMAKRDRGAILLGAHHGSMYAMRALAGDEALPIRAVVYTKHAALFNSLLARMDPESQARLIQMGEGVDFMMRIRDLVDEGALIALLGDRVGKDDRAVEVDFFGAPARFPTGPFLLAATLRCPIYLTFGLYRDPDGYDLYCEPFAEQVVLPRGKRDEALREYAQKYAKRLEHYVRLAPDNWFNFYEFWASPEPPADAEA